MLTIHHLGKSQSERIIWLCEELNLPYALKHYKRDAVTILSPPELRQLHPLGAAPVITDGDMVLPESGAIVQYILEKYAGGRLSHGPAHADYAQYVYWLHFANANFQSHMGRNSIIRKLNLPADNAVAAGVKERLDRVLNLIEARLGVVDYLAGADFTAADIMIVFTLTTMRIFFPLDLAPYANIRAYLQRIGSRPAYQKAMHIGDPDLVPMLT